MAVYRYLFADLRTNAILAELPLTGVSFTQALNTAGSFAAHLLLSDPRLTNYDIQGSTIPARTAIYVDRDGVLVWGGVLWTRVYSSETQTMNFTAREFESYFERRRIVTSVAFTTTDQLTVAQSLINTAQSATGGNIDIIVPSNTSGITVDRVYYSYELKDVWSAVKDLSTSSTGFDINIDVAYDSFGTPKKYLRTDYPYRGIPYVSTNAGALVLELPGNIVQYEYPDEGNITANAMYAIGPGSNEGKLIGSAYITTQVAAGWPLLEDTTTYNDVYDPTLLTNLAAGEVTAKQNPVVTAKVVIPAYVDPVLGSYKTGDEVMLRITDDRWVQQNNTGYGLTAIKRIVAIAVEPGENSPERVTLTLADPT